jgi:hypothetical protein
VDAGGPPSLGLLPGQGAGCASTPEVGGASFAGRRHESRPRFRPCRPMGRWVRNASLNDPSTTHTLNHLALGPHPPRRVVRPRSAPARGLPTVG